MAFNNSSRPVIGDGDQSTDLIPKTDTLGVTSVILIQIVIIVSSGFLIYIISRMRQKSPTNLLILNQTLSDLLNGVLFVSLVVLSHFKPSPALTMALSFTNAFIVVVSLLSLLALGIYRYKTCRRPLQNFRSQSSSLDNRSILKYVIGIWLGSFCVCLVPLTWLKASIKFQMIAFNIFHGFLWVALMSMFLLLIVLNIMLFKIVNQHLNAKVGGRSKTRSVPVSHSQCYTKSSAEFSADVGLKIQRKQKISEPVVDNTLLSVNSTMCNVAESYDPPAPSCATVDTADDTSTALYTEGLDATSNGSLLMKYRIRMRKKRPKITQRQKREIRMKRLLCALMLSIFVSYFPILVINFEHLFQLRMPLPSWIQTLSLYTFIANSAVSPFLCLLMKRDLAVAAKVNLSKVMSLVCPKSRSGRC